jgi:hypothetical protein
MASQQQDEEIAFQQRLVHYTTSIFNGVTFAQTNPALLASELLQIDDFRNQVLCGTVVSSSDLAKLLADIQKATATEILICNGWTS